MRFIRLLIIVLIIIFFAIVYTQNLEVFTHKFELQMDLNQYMIGPYITQNVVLILSAFVLGVVISIIFGAIGFIAAGSESRQKSRRIKELEAQLAERSNSSAPAVGSSGTDAGNPPASDESGSNPFTPPSS